MSESQLKWIEINLEELYEFVPFTRASDILESILKNYECIKVVATVNFSPDAGLEVSADNYEIEKMIYDKFYKIKDDETAIREVAKELNVNTIVFLYDGYESAVAFVKSGE
jgi:hypothetical protein